MVTRGKMRQDQDTSPKMKGHQIWTVGSYRGKSLARMIPQ